MIGNDAMNAPPAHALSKRGMIDNITGYPVYDPYNNIVAAVAKGDVDLAVVWGPQAAWYAKQQRVPLIMIRQATRLDPTRRWRNFDAFDWALNHAE